MARRGQSQKDAAEAIGIRQSSFSQRMTGSREWRKREIDALCGMYGKPYEYLFELKRKEQE
jgi:transcriptional regulator with XRE-family HTH domain